MQNFPHIPINTNRPLLNLLRAHRLSPIDAGVNGVRICVCHLPEGVLDDNRGIIAHAQFEEQNFLSPARAEKMIIPLGGGVPAIVLYKGIVRAQVHGGGSAAMRAGGNQIGRDAHIRLPPHHFAHDRFIILGFMAAGPAALEKPVIALRVEQAALIEARLLKAMIHVRGDCEIIPALYQLVQVFIHRLRRVLRFHDFRADGSQLYAREGVYRVIDAAMVGRVAACHTGIRGVDDRIAAW